MDINEPQELFWSGEMIIRSLQQLSYVSLDKCLHPDILDMFRSIDTVISQSELEEQLKEMMKYDENFPDAMGNNLHLIDDLKTMRSHPRFAQLIGLEGILNHLSSYPAGAYVPSQEWLRDFALELFKKHKSENPELPECSKYVALFEADKQANKMKTNELVFIKPEEVHRIVEKIYDEAKSHLSVYYPSEYQGTMEEVSEYLFDNRAYYLLPEFSHKFEDVLEDQKSHLTRAKHYYERFFDGLARTDVFTNSVSQRNITKIEHDIKLLAHQYTEAVVFLKSSVDYLQRVIDAEQELGFMEEVPSVSDAFPGCDATELMPVQVYVNKMLIHPRLLKYQPLIFKHKPLNWNPQMFLPILSPTNQLCLPTLIAFNYFCSLLTHKQTAVTTDNVRTIRTAIYKIFHFFQTEETILKTVDYQELMKLINAFREKFLTSSHGPHPHHDLLRVVMAPVADKFCQLMGDSVMSRRLTFYAVYPQAAVLIHNQKGCVEMWNLKDGCFCLLDLLSDKFMASRQRCAVPMNSVFVRCLRKNRCQYLALSKKEMEMLEQEDKPPVAVKPAKKPKIVKPKPSKPNKKAPKPKKVVREVEPIVKYTYAFRTCPIPEVKVDAPLYNKSILKTCLKIILDDKTYQWISSRKQFKESDKNEWFTWTMAMEIVEHVKSVIPNYDSVLAQIKRLRISDGSSMLFGTGKCIDWTNPNVVARSNEKRKAHDLKQNWIKALPFDDYFYPNDSDKKLFKILAEYLLDQLAALIGTSEIVTLKCPQDDLHSLMLDVKLKIRREKNNNARSFVEVTINKLTNLENDTEVIKQLIGIVWQESNCQILEDLLTEQFKGCHDETTRSKLIMNVLFKIHKAKMIREALCEVDKFGITKGFDKSKIEHVPIIRTVRNDTIVFEKDMKLGFDVAKLLKNEEVSESSNVNDPDTIQSFNYVSKTDITEIAQNEGFAEVPFEMVSLAKEATKNAPIPSPIHTLCIEASITLKDVLNILLREIKIFKAIDAKNIDTITIFIDDLMEYFKPEKNSTFCIDYDKTVELIDMTREKFKSFATETLKSGKQASSTDKKFLSSFGPMLLSISSTNLSKKEMEDLIYIVEIRTILFEYPEVAVCYHNQKMCSHEGKLAYCPLDYFDKDDNKDISYMLPDKCGFTNSETVERFKQEMKEQKLTRLTKCALENSKNKLKQKLKAIEKINNPTIEDSKNLKRIEHDVPAEDSEEEDDSVILDEVEYKEVEDNDESYVSKQETEEVECSDDSFDDDIEVITDEKFEISISEKSDHENVQEEQNIGDLKPREEDRILNDPFEEVITEIELSSSEESNHEDTVEEEGSTEILKSKKDVVESIESLDPASFVECSSGTFIVKNSQPNARNKSAGPSTTKNPNPFSRDFDFSQLFSPFYSSGQSEPINFFARPSTSRNFEKSTHLDRQTHHSPARRTKPTSSFKLGDYLPKNDETLQQKIQRLEQENQQLKWQVMESNADRDEWKKKNKNLLSAQIKQSETFDIGYYNKYIVRGKNMKREAEKKLKERSSNFADPADRMRAKEELEDFELELKVTKKKAQKNISALEANPNTPVDSLYKLGEWSDVFSETTLEKMKKICFICRDEMFPGHRAFICIQCNGEGHYDCYEKCQTASCPLCRKTWADRVDFPKLSM